MNAGLDQLSGRNRGLLAVMALLCATVCAPDAAATELFNRGPARLVLSGYVQQATGVTHLPWASEGVAKGLIPEDSAFQGGTLRVRWGLDLGKIARLDVHNRVLWNLSAPPQTTGMGSLIGVGSSAPPKRWLDLNTTLAKGDGFAVQHDLDRLKLTVETPVADLKLGRQAITWGFASVIPVADVWVQQSPFELDRIEKRGVDALRALMYPRDDIEMDLVIADRGSWAELSGGLRVAYGGDHVEAYVVAAKQWRDLWAAAGVTLLVDVWKIRTEVAAPWSLDDVPSGGPNGFDALRASFGVDRIGSDITVSAEVAWNGPGAGSPGGYLKAFSAPALQRGTSYVVGRLYGAALLSWKAGDLWTLSGTAMANLRDPSALLAATLQWDVAAGANLMASVYGGIGDAPDLSNPLAPRLGSEFGTYGVVALLQAVVHF